MMWLPQARRFIWGRHGQAWPPVPPVHGPRGSGVEAAEVSQACQDSIPPISGPAHRFSFGDRDNDPNGMMRDVAKKLTDQDIESALKVYGGASLI